MAAFPTFSRPLRLLGATAVLAIVLSGCSNSGPGSEEDLTKALTREGGFDDGQATCITAAVFDKYSSDDAALKKLSHATSYEQLTATDGIPGFADFFDNAVNGCTGN
jgi:hypothetical protein